MRAEVNEAVVLLLSVKLGKSGCWPLAPFFFFFLQYLLQSNCINLVFCSVSFFFPKLISDSPSFAHFILVNRKWGGEWEKGDHCPDFNREKDAISQTSNCELGLSEGITCALNSGAAFWPSPDGACCTMVVFPTCLVSCMELPLCWTSTELHWSSVLILSALEIRREGRRSLAWSKHVFNKNLI